MIKRLDAKQLWQVGGGSVFESSVTGLACAAVSAGAFMFVDLFARQTSGAVTDLGMNRQGHSTYRYAGRSWLGVVGAVIGLLVGEFWAS